MKYQWTQSTTAPAEGTFSTTFTSGGTITKSDGTGNNWYLWILAKDNAGNTTITRSNVFYIDNTPPTAPTYVDLTFQDGTTPYANGTWTNKTAVCSMRTGGSTDVGSGVAKYQISTNNSTWIDYSYAWNTTYVMTTEGIHYRYYRAVDNAGNVSTSISRMIAMDLTRPTVPTMKMAYGNGTEYTNNTTAISGMAVYIIGPSPGWAWPSSTDALSGVAGYLISGTGPRGSLGWTEYNYLWTSQIYSVPFAHGTSYRYLVAYDHAGNTSSPDLTLTIRYVSPTGRCPCCDLASCSCIINPWGDNPPGNWACHTHGRYVSQWW